MEGSMGLNNTGLTAGTKDLVEVTILFRSGTYFNDLQSKENK